jgi:uncharacterized membrane protein
MDDQNKPFDNDNLDIEDQGKSKKYWYNGYALSSFVYYHGFTNGVLRVDGDDFHDYILGNEQRKKYHNRRRRVSEEIAVLKSAITENETRIDDCEKKIVESKCRLPVLETEIFENQHCQAELEQSIKQLNEDKEAIIPYYNEVVAVIFIVVAIIFIIAEFRITSDMFFNVLNINKYTSYMIAGAIALSSFAIKPAIDRIFEEPYLQNRRRYLMKGLLAVFSVIALTALGFLGYYRNIAEAKKTMFEDNPDVTLEDLASIIDHPAMLTVYTLLSIIFALAGAICFSIGLPVFNLGSKKRRMSRKIKDQTESLKKLAEKLQLLREEWTAKNAAYRTAALSLSRLPDMKLLREKLEALKEQELQEIEYIFKYQEVADRAWYEEGRSRGGKYDLADKPIFEPIDIDDNYATASRSSDHLTVEMTPGRYLHERLRKLISYNLTKKQGFNGQH